MDYTTPKNLGRGEQGAAAAAATTTRKRPVPVIEWDLENPNQVPAKTILDERWMEKLHVVTCTGTEIDFKAGSNEMMLDKSTTVTVTAPEPKKNGEQLPVAGRRMSELYLKRKYSVIWPVSKYFAVLQSVDHTKSYKPLFRTVIDLETFDQLFGSKEKAEKVLNLVSERLDGLVTRWNALYSSDDPEVRARRSPIHQAIAIASHSVPARPPLMAPTKTHLVLLLSNYTWLKERLENCGPAITVKEDFYVSIKLASDSFRYSELSDELLKFQGYLYDSNGFSLSYGDFKELLLNKNLTYIFGPTVRRRYLEDLSFEAAVEDHQTDEAQNTPQKKRNAAGLIRKRLLFTELDVEEQDGEDVDRLLNEACEAAEAVSKPETVKTLNDSQPWPNYSPLTPPSPLPIPLPATPAPGEGNGAAVDGDL